MLTVSNYHYIRKDFSSAYPSIYGLTPTAFRAQLTALKEKGTFIHPNDLKDNMHEVLSSKTNYILITFDDGLKEQYTTAKPILEALNIPALFFVNTVNQKEREVSLVHKIHLLRSVIAPELLLKSFSEKDPTIGQLNAAEKKKARLHYNYDTEPTAYLKYVLNFKLSVSVQTQLITALFDQYFASESIAESLYMSVDQLQSLADQGMLGSHAHRHVALGLLSANEIKEELANSKQYLEEKTRSTIFYVSYPYGNYEACADPVPAIATECGYTIGFTMERGINTGEEHPLLLKRFDCNDLTLGKNEKVFEHAYRSLYK